MPVVRARHAPIEFGKQEEVCVGKRRMLLQDSDDAIESHSSLNVPCNHTDRITAGHTCRCEILTPDVIQHAIDAGFQFLIEGETLKVTCVFETGEILEKRPER